MPNMKSNLFSYSGQSFETPTFRQYELPAFGLGMSQKTKK